MKCSRCGDEIEAGDQRYIKDSRKRQERDMCHVICVWDYDGLSEPQRDIIDSIDADDNPLTQKFKDRLDEKFDSLNEIKKNRLKSEREELRQEDPDNIEALEEMDERIERVDSKVGTEEDLVFDRDLEIRIYDSYDDIEGSAETKKEVLGRFFRKTEIDVPRRLVVCEDCLKEDDEVIW